MEQRHQGMGRCRYAPAVLSLHRFAAAPPVHEPRAATPSATHTLMLLWKYLVNKITPEHIKCDWVRCYNVGHVACLVCIITPEDAAFLCSHRAFLSLSIRDSFFFQQVLDGAALLAALHLDLLDLFSCKRILS